MSENIGIVVVSHSAMVAESVALMSGQMSGGDVRVSHCGGDVVAMWRAAWGVRLKELLKR